jgi:hypothetical protein
LAALGITQHGQIVVVGNDLTFVHYPYVVDIRRIFLQSATHRVSIRIRAENIIDGGSVVYCRLIELEAEFCSLDSLGAFTDEHYCGPAVTQSMHSDDTHSQMWVGSGLTGKARGLIYSNPHRDSNGKNQKMSLPPCSRLLRR